MLLCYLDSIREVRKHSHEHVKDPSKQHAEIYAQVKQFRSQRNFYVAGFALFFWLYVETNISQCHWFCIWLLSIDFSVIQRLVRVLPTSSNVNENRQHSSSTHVSHCSIVRRIDMFNDKLNLIDRILLLLQRHQHQLIKNFTSIVLNIIMRSTNSDIVSLSLRKALIQRSFDHFIYSFTFSVRKETWRSRRNPTKIPRIKGRTRTFTRRISEIKGKINHTCIFIQFEATKVMLFRTRWIPRQMMNHEKTNEHFDVSTKTNIHINLQFFYGDSWLVA